MRTSVVLVIIGMLLITMNTLLGNQDTKTQRTRIKYIPRELDAWFKDPENQPMYMYSSMFQGENIRTY